MSDPYSDDYVHELQNEIEALESKLHQLSEDHSHCEDLLHELGSRASSAESRLHSVRLFIDTPHPHWGQGEVLDGVREILDGVVESQKQFGSSRWDRPEVKAEEAEKTAAMRGRVDALLDATCDHGKKVREWCDECERLWAGCE
jgi:chromosome segregation ATPase